MTLIYNVNIPENNPAAGNVIDTIRFAVVDRGFQRLS